MSQPRTVAELLDAAASMPDKGEAFAAVINSLFVGLEQAMDEEQR